MTAIDQREMREKNVKEELEDIRSKLFGEESSRGHFWAGVTFAVPESTLSLVSHIFIARAYEAAS